MPKYSAMVTILKGGKPHEDICFENFHASGQKPAENLINQQAGNYVAANSDEDSGNAYGYKVLYCARKELVDDWESQGRDKTDCGSTRPVKQVAALPSSATELPCAAVIKDKFDKEKRGDFTAPYFFSSEVVLEV